MKRVLDRTAEINRSIMKGFRSRIWSKFTKAIAEYHLIEENDHIAVCISGGKDSMILALCMQQLEKYGDVPFKCTYMVMNPGYNEANKQKIIENAYEGEDKDTCYILRIFYSYNSISRKRGPER